MKSVVSISICLLLFLQIAWGQNQTENNNLSQSNQVKEIKSNYPNLKLQAEEVGKATVNQDFAKIVDYSYPKFDSDLGPTEI